MTEKTDFYVPMNDIFKSKETGWTFTQINLSYEEISKRGIVIWCVENMQDRWTMLGGSKFGFQDPTDALNFKIKFGL
jgi:hypothetical protein